MSIRTRFAPSPTGYLHVGSARTALYSWLFARKHKGTFILRIEDTDQERSTQESVEAIFEGLSWLGLTWDEGPFYQTDRFDRYQAATQQLLDAGKAYRCYCSKERLELLREEQVAAKQKPRYDGFCRKLALPVKNQPYVIRFANPLEGEVVVNDQVFGPVVFKNSELDDLIIARSDGSPTYNFTVVVDDWDMKITHVIRGDDHLNNTPRQMNILDALGAQPPIYAHIPMILGPDGKRLSKRHGAVSVTQYRDEGYMPEALLNYLVRLGWSHGDQEIFSQEEMISLFDLKEVNRAAAAFDPQKLQWLNQHYLKMSPIQEITGRLAWHMYRLGLDLTKGADLIELVELQRERAKTLHEMAEKSRFFYEEITVPELPVELLGPFETLHARFKALASWTNENIHAILVETATQNDLPLGKLAQPVRMAISGGTVSPPIDSTLRLLGKEKVLERLHQAIRLMQTGVYGS